MSGAGCLQFFNLEFPLNVEYLIVGYSTWKKFRSSHIFVSAFISVQLILHTMDQPRLASHLWNYARCAVAEPACIASTKALYKARPPFQWASSYGQQESPSDVPMKNKGYVHKVRICKLRCKCTLYASVHKTTYVTPSVSAILFCVEPQVRKTRRNPGVCPQTGVPLGRDKVVFLVILVNNDLCLLLEVPQTMDTRFSSWCNLCTVLLKSNTVCCSWGS